MYESSFGIIPLKKDEFGEWQVLLIQHHPHSHWSFPKGHAENQESFLEAACRELHEETGLTVVELLFQAPLFEEYQFRLHGQLIFKTVSYYVASVEGTLKLQEEEISASKWVSLKEAESHLTFPQGKNIAKKVLNLLSSDH